MYAADNTHRTAVFRFAGSQRFNIFPFHFPRVDQKLSLKLLSPVFTADISH